ncbi:MAG: DUF2336 domain-containing protein [Candidatus Accumulibacter sp.]|nr:DUF2336 domain-containing protein [Accumulibacter sp.]
MTQLAGNTDPRVRVEVASHKNTPVTVLEKLARDAESWVRTWVVFNDNTPESVLSLLVRDEDTEIRKRIASDKKTSPALLALLAKDENAEVRWYVAENENTSPEIWDALARDNDLQVRCGVAGSTRTPEVLALLARDEECDVRVNVARNEHAPLDTLTILTTDGEARVREAIAEKTTSPELLMELAKDTEEGVRREVVENEHTPLAVLEKLAQDTECTVRLEVAENRRTPLAVLKKLARDEIWWVRDEVASHIHDSALLTLLAQDEDCHVRRNVARNEHTPPTVLETLADDTDEDVIEAVADNERTTTAVLARLAMHVNQSVRCNVALNEATPRDVLMQLAGDADAKVRRYVARAPHTPRAVLEILAHDPEALVWRATLKNESLPRELAEMLNQRLAEETARIARPATLEEIQRIKPALVALEDGLRDDIRYAIRRLTYARLAGKEAEQCLDTNWLPRAVFNFYDVEVGDGGMLPSDIFIVPPGRHEVPFSLLARENKGDLIFIGLSDADGHKPTLILRDDTSCEADEKVPEVIGFDLNLPRFANLRLEAEKPTLLGLHLQNWDEDKNDDRFEHYLHEVECAPNVEFCDANRKHKPLHAQRDWALALQETPEWEKLWLDAALRNFRNTNELEDLLLDMKTSWRHTRKSITEMVDDYHAKTDEQKQQTNEGFQAMLKDFAELEYAERIALENDMDRVLSEHGVDFSDDDEIPPPQRIRFCTFKRS